LSEISRSTSAPLIGVDKSFVDSPDNNQILVEHNFSTEWMDSTQVDSANFYEAGFGLIDDWFAQ
jgi:hypothetical protein